LKISEVEKEKFSSQPRLTRAMAKKLEQNQEKGKEESPRMSTLQKDLEPNTMSKNQD
jgi:hypothetical protein